MNEITIQRHSFDLAKNRLKEFSEKTEAELEIDKVQTDGIFGWGDHKVTGNELNRRLETIQGHFIAVNTTNNKVIKEFREIYNALDALDKDYISSIVANVKAIEKTSNDVRVQQGILKQHHETLSNQQSKLDEHQVEIEKNVDNISKIVTALKVFKEKLESYNHLTDIDRIWNDCKTIQNDIRIVSDGITKFSKKIAEDIAFADNKNKALSEQVNQDILILRNETKSSKKLFSDLSRRFEYTADLLNNQIPVIQETSTFAKKLKKTAHIYDVDSMWNDISKAKKSFNIIESSLQNIEADILKMQEHIDEIKSFITVLNSYNHLQDIDNMWDDLDVVKTNIQKINEDINENSENIQIYQNELEALATTSTEHKESIDVLFKKLADSEEYAVNNRNSITELESFSAKVSALHHLMDVDEIWKQTEDHQLRIIRAEQDGKSHTDKLNELMQADDRIRESIDLNVRDINFLKEYKEKLGGISHLDDVDSIWKDVEEHTSLLAESQKKNEELATTIQKNKDEVESEITDAVQMANAAVESLTKRVKYAYLIAGGSAGLAIIELVLLLMKVI